jgi:DNA-binding transcriptional LysR family regulator
MEMQQVRYFLAVCDELNFTRAAKNCRVAQPTLSIAIARLEAELGAELFLRSSDGVRLTPVGRSIWPHLRQIDRHTERAQALAAKGGAGTRRRTRAPRSRPH